MNQSNVTYWLSINWQWVITFFLLVISVGLGLSTRAFQIRTSIRESLEQIDHEHVKSATKIVAMLYEFRYWSFNRGITLLLQYKNFDSRGAGGVSSLMEFGSVLDTEEIDETELSERIEAINGVQKTEIKDTGLFVYCSTLSGVKARDIAIEASSVVRDMIK